MQSESESESNRNRLISAILVSIQNRGILDHTAGDVGGYDYMPGRFYTFYRDETDILAYGSSGM